MTATYQMTLHELTPEFLKKLNSQFDDESSIVEITVHASGSIHPELEKRIHDVELKKNLKHFDEKEWEQFVKENV